MRSLFQLIMDIFALIMNKIKALIMAIVEKFLEINPFEKGIALCTALAFAAAVVPMAKYMIFGEQRNIINPDVHYLIGITAVMLVTIYFPGMISTGARIVLNLLYLADMIYLLAAHAISKAPYEIAAGYYLNIIVPVMYIILSAGSVLVGRGR